MVNKNLYIVIDQTSLAVSLTLKHFVKENEIVSFIIGLLIGLFLVSNRAFLINFRKAKSEDV